MIKFDKKTGLPNLGDISEKEISDARAISSMMRTQGWKAFLKYQELIKDSLVDKIANYSVSVENKELCFQYGAVLNGFRHFMNLAGTIVKRAEDYQPTEVPDEGNDE